MTFTGSMVAIVTPLKDNAIDEVALKNLIDLQITNGTSVIVPCGTTGESATLTHEEHEKVIALTVEHVAGRAKVLAGAGSNSTSEALRFHKECEKVGADGALHITPYYNKPTQDGLYQHFKTLAETSSFPIVLYNVPGRTGVHMQTETVLKLAEHNNIVGIKEASGSLIHATEIIANAPENFYLYSGEDSLNFPLYAIGAKGAISVTCNVVPELCAELFQAVQDQNFEKAKALHYGLYDLNQTLFLETNPIPVKAALNMMGLIEEEYRLPLVKISAQNRETLKDILKKMNKVF